MDRKGRLQNARATKWVENYTGKDLVRGYRRWYGVDALSAVVELQLLGVADLEERKQQALRELERQAQANVRRKEQRRQENEAALFDQDETFAYIAGYTPAVQLMA